MDDLFLLTFLVSIVAVAVFIFKGFKNGWKFYKKKVFISLGVMVASFILFGLTVDSEEVAQKQEQMELAEQQEAEEKERLEKEQAEKEQKEKDEKEKEQKEKEKKEKEEKEKAEKEKAEKEEVEEAPEPSEVQFDPNDYNAELTYDDLARNPDEHIFKAVTFEGKIIQVMQGSDRSQYRIATNDNYDKVMFLEIDNSQLDSRILEDDYIRFWGTYLGEITYESTFGGNITIPGVIVDNFEFQ